jgi:small subunit ribosomal protein S13
MDLVYYKLIKYKGIGPTVALKICTHLGISLKSTYKDLSPEKLDNLNLLLGSLRKLSVPGSYSTSSLPVAQQNMLTTKSHSIGSFNVSPIDFSLYLFDKKNIDKYISLNTYRGKRHKLGYPVRGQRTRSNARTARHINKPRFA